MADTGYGPFTIGNSVDINAGDAATIANGIDAVDITIDAGASGATVDAQLLVTNSLGITTTAGGAIDINEIAMGSLAENTINTAGSIVLNADGDLDVNRNLTAGGMLDLDSATGNITVGQVDGMASTLISTGNLSVDSVMGDISLASITQSTGGSVSLDAMAGSVSTADYTEAYTYIDINAGQDITVNEALYARNLMSGTTGDLTVTAGNNISIGGPILADNVIVDATGGSVTINTLTPGFTLVDGNLDIDALTSITLNQALDVLGDVTFDAGAMGITLNDDINNAVNITLTTTDGGDITVDEVVNIFSDDTLAASGAVVFNASGAVDLSRNIDAGTQLTIDAAIGNITSNQVAGSPVNLTANGDLNVTAAMGDINLSSVNNSTTGAVTLDATAGSVLASGTNQAFTNVGITAGQNATLSSVTESTNAMMLGNVTVSADDNIDVNDGITGANVTLNATAGNVSVNTAAMSSGLNASNLLDIDAGNGVTLNQAVSATSNLTIDADAGGVVVNDALNGSGNIAITTTTGGAIDINEIAIAMPTPAQTTINATGSIALNADGNLDVNRNLTAGTTLGLDSATGDITVGQVGGVSSGLISNGDLSISADGSITLDAFSVSNNSSISFNATNGSITTPGGFMGTAVDAASGFTATADQNVTILGDIFVTDGMSTGDLSVSAGDDITIGGQFYGNFVTFDATDGSVLLEQSTVGYSNVDALLTIDAGNSLTINEGLRAAGIDVQAGAGGITINDDIDITGSGILGLSTVDGGDININALQMGSLMGDDTLSSSNSVDINASGGLNLSRNIMADTTVFLQSQTGAVTVNQVNAMPASINTSGNLLVRTLMGDINLQSVNTSSAGAIEIDARNGNVLASGTNQAFTDVDITADQNVTLNGVTESTNAMMLGNITVSADNNIDVNDGITGANVTLDAIAGNVTINTSAMSSGLNASNMLDINAGNGFTLDQPVISTSDLIIDAGAGGVEVNAEISTIGNLAITTTAGGAIDVNDIAMGTAAENTISAGGSIDLDAAGDLNFNRNVVAGTTLDLSATGNIIIDQVDGFSASLISGGDITIDADQSVNLVTANLSTTTGDNLIVNAGDTVDLTNSFLNTLGDIYIQADTDDSGVGSVSIVDSTLGAYTYLIGVTNSVSIEGAGVTLGGLAGNTSITALDSVIQSTGTNSIDLIAGTTSSVGSVDIETINNLSLTSDGDINIVASDDSAIGALGNNSVSVITFGSQSIVADNLSITVGEGFNNEVAIVVDNSAYSPVTPSILPSQTINVSNITIDASAADSGGGATIGSFGSQTINVSNNFIANGVAIAEESAGGGSILEGGVYGGQQYNIFVGGLSGQTISVGNRLELSSVGLYAANYELGVGAVSSTISTSDLVVSNARIAAVGMDEGSENAFVLTTTGANSTIDGILNPAGPENFALVLNGVNWLNTGSVQWNSGTVEITNQSLPLTAFNISNGSTKTTESREVLFVNEGQLQLNSESGTFDLILFDATGVEVGVGDLLNTGEILKLSGTGTTNASLNLQNDGGRLIGASGTLDFGANTITQTGEGAELVLDGGNIAATGGTIDLQGGLLGGGVDSSAMINLSITPEGGILNGTLVAGPGSVSSGGTLIGDVSVTDTLISPGFSPGLLTIDGDLDATGGGNTVLAEVDAQTGEFDQLIVLGDANFDGTDNTIQITQLGDFNPDLSTQVDEDFTLIGASSLTLGATGVLVNADDASVIGTPEVIGNELAINFFRDAEVQQPDPEPPVIENPDPEPPVVEMPDPLPPVVQAPVDPEPPMVDAPEVEAPVVTPEPEAPVVVVIDDVPLVLPADIIDVIVNLDEDEQQEFLESEEVKRFIKKVNMCLAST